jgi:hypothetical protein
MSNRGHRIVPDSKHLRHSQACGEKVVVIAAVGMSSGHIAQVKISLETVGRRRVRSNFSFFQGQGYWGFDDRET